MTVQLNEHNQSEVLFWHLMSNRNTGFALAVDGDRVVVVVENEND